MLSIHDHGTPLCDGLTRREWLRVGGLSALGLSLPSLLSARTPTATSGKAKACILFNLTGGPPQHETWDPKPDAPAEIRGPFKSISSSVPGLHVCELMPRVAKLAHRCAVLRAVSTRDNAHSSSGYYMLTGQPHQPPNVESAKVGAPNNWPSLAAVVRHLHQGRSLIPSSVVVPEHIWNDGNFPWPGQDAGWLGRSSDPWLLHCDLTKSDSPIAALSLPEDVALVRIDARRTLLEQVNRYLDSRDRGMGRRPFDDQYRQAFDLIRAPKARQAFDLGQESATLRDRYGRHRFGQGCLLARRLVEAGVKLIQVNWVRMKSKAEDPNQGGWDTHAKNAASLKDWLMPIMDQTFSTLLDDLSARGLLDSTLVVWMGEFGRTPKHNANGGRDHWGNVFSLALAGGGVRGGVVHGSSDAQGAEPKDGRVLPEDLTATIFHCLGISPGAEIHDALRRPVPVSRGSVIRQIL